MHDCVPDFLQKSNPKPTHQYDLFLGGAEFFRHRTPTNSRRAPTNSRPTIRSKIKFFPRKSKAAPASADPVPFSDSLEDI
jgi:hypothetical protein